MKLRDKKSILAMLLAALMTLPSLAACPDEGADNRRISEREILRLSIFERGIIV